MTAGAAPTPSTSLTGSEVLADPLVRELLAARLIGVLSTAGALLPAAGEFLASDDIAVRLVPAAAFTWDERQSAAARELAAQRAARPLRSTSPCLP